MCDFFLSPSLHQSINPSGLKYVKFIYFSVLYIYVITSTCNALHFMKVKMIEIL